MNILRPRNVSRILSVALNPRKLGLYLRRRAAHREGIRFRLQVSTAGGVPPPSYSQCLQDRYVAERIANRKRGGVFIDIGANDGITNSNSKLFEEIYGWTGICVEPHPDAFHKLAANRSTKLSNCGVGSKSGTLEFLQVIGSAEQLSGLLVNMSSNHLHRVDENIRELGGSKQVILVQVRRLTELLEAENVHVADFMSIDIEGGELSILKSVDLDRTRIHCIAVENNESDETAIQMYMELRGYHLACVLKDEIYVASSNSPNSPLIA